MCFSNKIFPLILLYFCVKSIYSSVRCNSYESDEHFNKTIQTNISHEEEDVKIPLYNKNQVNINYDDLMNILDKAPSPHDAFENITKIYRQTTPESSVLEPEGNPYFPKKLPKFNYDEGKNLMLFITCVRGTKNRLIDAGEGKLIVQVLAPDYEDAFDAEIGRFLSGVFQVPRADVSITKGYIENERKVWIKAEAVALVSPLYRILSVLEPQES